MATNKRANWASPADIDRVRNKRWTEQDARGVLAALESSGLTISAFAKLHQLDHQRIRAWARRSAAHETATFVPVVVRPERDEDRVALVVRLGAQPSLEIRMPERVSATWVAALLRELGEGQS